MGDNRVNYQMALTKNYYVMEEVRAALAYACKERKQEEAVFWCHELVISCAAHQALETLYDCWLWTYGACRLAWLAMAQNTDLDKLPRLAQLLASFERDAQDSSLWVILRETCEQPDRVAASHGLAESRSAPLALPEGDLASYYLLALKQHKAAAAWWAGSQLGIAKSLELALQLYPERAAWLGAISRIDLPSYERATHCLLVCSAALWQSAWDESVKPLTPIPDPYRIATAPGPRTARKYAIPSMALYGITERGRMRQTETTIEKLRSIEPQLRGPYWDPILKKIGAVTAAADGKIVWPSEDAIEYFYEKYFPDDIPDEWPLAEQEKSHGRGVLGATEQLSQAKLARIWLPRRQRLCWLQASEADSLAGSLAALALAASEPAASASDCLKPVIKRLVGGAASGAAAGI